MAAFLATNFVLADTSVCTSWRDDTAGVQAVNRVQETARRGIVFIPSGGDRPTPENQGWRGIRLIGYGTTRPLLVRGEKTPVYRTASENFSCISSVNTGKSLRVIEVPGLPGALVLDGADRKTLFIAARSSFYSIPTATRER